MKRTILVAAAVASFAVPAAAPLAVLAQDGESGGGRRGAARQNGAEDGPRMRAPTAEPQAHIPRPDGTPALIPPQQRQERREERRENRQENRHERREDRQDNRQERRENRQENRQERREDRQDRRNGAGGAPAGGWQDLPGNRQERREDRRENRQERREDRQDNRQDRREERRENRQERREDRREYREFRQRFSGDQWRRDWSRRHGREWWRNDRRWRGYTGVRIGFYFAPGYGYYSVPRGYYRQRWYEGQYLPSVFWRYRLDDWRTYGLGYPPVGTRWVLVDNHIYLIDEYDGYIIDVIYDAWTW